MDNYSPRMAFKFDNNPPTILNSMTRISDPDKVITPYSKWSKHQKLIIRELNIEYIFNLKNIVKGIEAHKKCKQNLNKQ